MKSQVYVEGLKMFVWHLLRKIVGYPKHEGSAEEICEKIIKKCWNGSFFQVSTGHYNLFYIRDFGWCTESLLKLGYKEQIKKSLEFALKHYEKNGRITTTITKKGKCFDFPVYSVDSLPYLIRSLNLLNNKSIIRKHEKFLNHQIKLFYEIVIDKQTGLVKSNHFSSMRDHVISKSSCYNNCFVALLADELKKTKLFNPFKGKDYAKLIQDTFWNGNYFYNDLSKRPVIAGDANLFPIYLMIIKNKAIRKKTLQSMLGELSNPFPLMYTKKRNTHEQFIAAENLVPDWETDSIWMHMGPIFVSLLKEEFPKKHQKFKKRYQELIQKNGTVHEVFNKKEKPYTSLVYSSDAEMLWACNFLVLFKDK